VVATLAVGVLHGASGPLHVSVQPRVVVLGGHAAVQIEGWRPSQLEVALEGATDRSGRLLGWHVAERLGRTWTAELPRPALRGIYPLLLRTRTHSAVVRSPRWLLRVFRRTATQEPTFTTPEDVVRWWVRTVPGGRLTALRRWQRPAFDKREPALHRLFVVAYEPPGRTGVANRLGMFVTAVRDGYHGRWRLLEATVQP
jgi:hypothetical protein